MTSLGPDLLSHAHSPQGAFACFLEFQSGCLPTHAHSWGPDECGQHWWGGLSKSTHTWDSRAQSQRERKWGSHLVRARYLLTSSSNTHSALQQRCHNHITHRGKGNREVLKCSKSHSQYVAEPAAAWSSFWFRSPCALPDHARGDPSTERSRDRS